MNTTLGTAELQEFQSAIARRLGLRFDDGKLTFLAEVLGRRMAARSVDAAAYLEALQGNLSAENELRALALELTVGETYFFRHAEQFSALCEVALPERTAGVTKSGTLRLMSVGCASGEEPYTLAILLQQRAFDARFKVEIIGMDLNPESLQKARRGLYSAWSLRETPPAVRERWFQSEGQSFRIAASVRDSVQFHEHNLIRPSPELLSPSTCDVIFCRNVLMYFTPEHAADIVQRLARALVPGGFLFLGHAETLRGLSQAFHLRHTHNTFYYQRKDVLPVDYSAAPATPNEASAVAAVAGPWTDHWLQAVQASSDRIRELSEPRPSATESEPPATLTALLGRHDLRQPLELLQSERFSEALDSLPQSPAALASDPTALLLRAALLTHQGELSPAEAACRQLLELDELNAGAHYLLALCFERKEELSVAAEHARTAVYLDAGFAMPHLHLGLMARRRHDAEAARREIGQALWLLEREDPARLLLFGGGFTRAALLDLCRSELENLRGAR